MRTPDTPSGVTDRQTEKSGEEYRCNRRANATRSVKRVPHGAGGAERKARTPQVAEDKTPSGPRETALLKPLPGFKRACNRHVTITMTLPICYSILSS